MPRRFATSSVNSAGIKGAPNPTATLKWINQRTIDGGSGSFSSAQCWSPELALFAVLGNTNTNRILTSPDGHTWTARTAPVAAAWVSIAWSPKLHRFVGCADSAVTMYSDDGITWTQGGNTSVVGGLYRRVIWCPELSMFIATGDGIFTSTNGITWTTQTAPVHLYSAVAWSPELGLLVAVVRTLASNTQQAVTSPDGVNWTQRTTPTMTPSNGYAAVAWSPAARIFVAVSETGDGPFVMSSPDGINWTLRSSPVATYGSCTWVPALGMFIIGGGARIITSANGIDWATPSGFTSVPEFYGTPAWSPTLGFLFAAGFNGATTRLGTLDENNRA